jgi:hypothetical protein
VSDAPKFRPSETSFRDPESGVTARENDVLRYFRGRAIDDFVFLRDAGLFHELAEREMILPLAPYDGDFEPSVAPSGSVVVRQPRLPFISYPYEWPFAMLRSAGLLYLDLLTLSLDRGAMLKDATPYNVQFAGTKPRFIDLGSFERYREGRPWAGYAQFCSLFLNPLILEAYVGIPFQPWLRSSLDGVSAAALSRVLPTRAKLRPTIFTNVLAQAFLGGRLGSATPKELGVSPVIPKKAVLRHVAGLREFLAALRPKRRRSEWSKYEEIKSYTSVARAKKAAFIEEALSRVRPTTVWDLGCNLGEYSILASKYAAVVIAMDSDPMVVDALYESADTSGLGIVPLVMDLTNPSPDQGWDQRERGGLAARGPADLTLVLALAHHLRLHGNIPTGHFVRWLKRVSKNCVVEFIPKSDPAAERLLAWRDDVYDDYDEAQFESELAASFAIEEKCRLPDSKRVLYRGRAR